MRRALWSIVAAAAALFPVAPAHGTALVVATSQACTGTAVGECENAPPVFGAGQTAQKSKSWTFEGFSYLTDTNMTLDYLGFSAFARASGFENPVNPGDGTFLYSITRIGRTIGTVIDALTAGEGGADGFLRLPFRVTGQAAVAWQNGLGTASVGVGCSSNDPGGFVVIGTCTPVQLTFTTDQLIDQEIVVDVPIVLGEPFEYRLQVSIEASTGHPYGSAIPFTGAAEISVEAGGFAGAIVLDASRTPIPGAPISASESGFSYAPEAGTPLATAVAITALASIRARRRRSKA